MSVAAHCEREVRELHTFFEAWFNGTVPSTDDAFSRLPAVLAPDFKLVSPSGRCIDRDQVIELVRTNHPDFKATPPDAEVEIRIDRFTVHLETADFILVRYQEWQARGGPATGRQSSAVFRVNDSAPLGLQWIHLHETWITPPS